MWKEVESYRQLEHEYDQALADYTREEQEYRELLGRNPHDASLPERFRRLEEMRENVGRRYERLTELRREMASRQSSAMGFGA